jgi:hypothetical protein
MDGPVLLLLISIRSIDTFAARGNFFFWLVDFYKSSPENTWPNELKLGRKHLLKSSIMIAHLRPELLTNVATIRNFFSWLVDF